jgi:uncharacterized protein involved in exopolysaccharide biosynthesis
MTEETKSSTKYVMVESSPSVDEDEIDLLELIRTLLQAWKTIVGITIVCVGLAVAYALHAPEVFKAKALLAPAQEDETAASSLLNKFGGLVAIAGVKDKSDAFMSRVLGTVNSFKFLSELINNNNLLIQIFAERWNKENSTWVLNENEKEPTVADAVALLADNILIEEVKGSSLYTLQVSSNNRNLSAAICNQLIVTLNDKFRKIAIQNSLKRIEYLNQELAKTKLEDMRAVLFNLMTAEKQKAMISNIEKDAAFEVIDPAVAPEAPEKPKRKLIVALGGVCGGFLGIFAVFFAQFLRKLKSSSEKVH